MSHNHYYLKNIDYWLSGWYFFVYFFIMGTCFPFLGIWLGDIIGLSGSDIGLVFALMSFVALFFQPILGFLTDKLSIKKYILYIVAFSLLFYAPFFIYIFTPLLKQNVVLGAFVGGLYMGFVFKGGAPASEAFFDKISRIKHFEYGRARLFGMFGWGICASISGVLYSLDPNMVFWLGSFAAIILIVLVALMQPEKNLSGDDLAKIHNKENPVTLKQAFALFKLPKFWFLTAYMLGVACTYDIFEQQFGNFFNTFFATKQQGMQFYGYVTTVEEFLNGVVMFFVPVLINRYIGAKNALLLAGCIAMMRIFGSAFAVSDWQIIVLKMLHLLEVPFYLLGLFKYIGEVFEMRFSATVYLIACQFLREVVSMFESPLVGKFYDWYGYQHTYLGLGTVIALFTLFAFFSLQSSKKLGDQ